jgi:hypothetical protein
VTENRFVIGPRLSDGSFRLLRMPDGVALSARPWDDVWAACLEFNVPWRASPSVTWSSVSRFSTCGEITPTCRHKHQRSDRGSSERSVRDGKPQLASSRVAQHPDGEHAAN